MEKGRDKLTGAFMANCDTLTPNLNNLISSSLTLTQNQFFSPGWNICSKSLQRTALMWQSYECLGSTKGMKKEGFYLRYLSRIFKLFPFFSWYVKIPSPSPSHLHVWAAWHANQHGLPSHCSADLFAPRSCPWGAAASAGDHLRWVTLSTVPAGHLGVFQYIIAMLTEWRWLWK